MGGESSIPWTCLHRQKATRARAGLGSVATLRPGSLSHVAEPLFCPAPRVRLGRPRWVMATPQSGGLSHVPGAWNRRGTRGQSKPRLPRPHREAGRGGDRAHEHRPDPPPQPSHRAAPGASPQPDTGAQARPAAPTRPRGKRTAGQRVRQVGHGGGHRLGGTGDPPRRGRGRGTCRPSSRMGPGAAAAGPDGLRWQPRATDAAEGHGRARGTHPLLDGSLWSVGSRQQTEPDRAEP